MLTSEYSLWFLPLCVLLGLAYAFVLYYKSTKPELPLWVKRLAFITRSFAVFLLAFLLLNPLLKTVHKEKEKPVIILGIDNSESMLMCKDSTYYENDFLRQLKQTIQQLSKKYVVETYLLGDSLQKGMNMDFKDKETNISSFFETIQAKYFNQNVGALVLVSDGIYNKGQNPLYEAKNMEMPIYTVAMGDTSIHQDLLIAKVNYNKTVFKNNFFPIEVLVHANKLKNKQSKLQIVHKNEVVFEKIIHITNHEYAEWIRVNFEAKQAGLLHYHIQLLPIENEMTTYNNTSDIYIQIVDNRNKIAIVYQAPHPDVSAITQALKKNDAYQIETFPIDKFTQNVNAYEVLILHQLPSKSNPAKQLLEESRKLGISTFYISGKQTNYAYLNSLNLGLQLQISKEAYNDVYPIYNQNFTTFSVSPSTQQIIASFPPVQVPFANFRLAPSASSLFFQKIGNVNTTYPLFVFNQTDDVKSAVFVGDGLWRWRNYNYMLENNHEAFDEIIMKTIQYLAVKEDKSFFRVKTSTIFNENEPIMFDAELYNQNYELVNDPEVTMVISNHDKKYTYSFSRTFKSYMLDAGNFPEGEYQWVASVSYGNQKYSKSGFFNVKKINVEFVNLVANHQLMKNISSVNNGEMFYPNQLKEMEKSIINNNEIKTIARYIKQHDSLLNSVLLLIGIFLLLGTEWVLRKWSGSY